MLKKIMLFLLVACPVYCASDGKASAAASVAGKSAAAADLVDKSSAAGKSEVAANGVQNKSKPDRLTTVHRYVNAKGENSLVNAYHAYTDAYDPHAKDSVFISIVQLQFKAKKMSLGEFRKKFEQEMMNNDDAEQIGVFIDTLK